MAARIPTRALAALGAFAVVAAAIAWALRARGPSFADPPADALHARPLADRRLFEVDFPESEGWRIVAYELAVAGSGRLTVRLEDRGRALVEHVRALSPGTEVVALGVRRLEPDLVRARYPAELRAEEERLTAAAGGEARGFHEWRLVRTARPRTKDGGAAPPAAVERSEGAIPRAATPPLRGETGVARLGIAEAHGFTALPGGEAIAIQDWIALPKSFRAFDRAFAPRLPDQIGVDGVGQPLATYGLPVWRVTVRWDPDAARP